MNEFNASMGCYALKLPGCEVADYVVRREEKICRVFLHALDNEPTEMIGTYVPAGSTWATEGAPGVSFKTHKTATWAVAILHLLGKTE